MLCCMSAAGHKKSGQVLVPRSSHHTFASNSWPLITGSRALVGAPSSVQSAFGCPPGRECLRFYSADRAAKYAHPAADFSKLIVKTSGCDGPSCFRPTDPIMAHCDETR